MESDHKTNYVLFLYSYSHMEKMALMEMQPFQCSQCDKRFSVPSILPCVIRISQWNGVWRSIRGPTQEINMIHRGSTIQIGEKPFKCTKCDQLSSSALEDQCEGPHRREAIPVFKVWQEFLRFHLYIQTQEDPHRREAIQLPKVCQEFVSSRPDRGDKSFQCSECDKNFSEALTLCT